MFDDRAQNEVTGMVVIVGLAVILSLFFGFVVFQNFTAPGDDVPKVAFEYTHDEATEALTITHNAGDAFAADEVFVLVRDANGSVTGTRVWGGSGTVSSGDSITVEGVERGASVRIVWVAGAGERTYVIGRWGGSSS
ncbi:type IV pilin [Natronomonas sp. CBA1123]|uniref:type IV pilin n=1 Tax=Natronomonas sp. CBA1123 TaxID=2668070 RepID=UPI0012EAB589|nr:type IV pilin [Natronomonas sp. CBA1123]